MTRDPIIKIDLTLVNNKISKISFEKLEDRDTVTRLKINQKLDIQYGYSTTEGIQIMFLYNMKLKNQRFSEQQLTTIMKFFNEKKWIDLRYQIQENLIRLEFLYYEETRKLTIRHIPTKWTTKEMAAYILCTGELPTKKQAMKLAQEHEKG